MTAISSAVVKRKYLLIVASTVAVLGAAGVVAVQALPVSEFLYHETETSFATLPEAQAHKGRALEPPSWVPGDVKDIRVKVKTDGPAQLLRFDLASGELPRQCTTVAPNGAPSVLDADWWPASVASRADRACGTWRVAVVNGTAYAWQTVESFDQYPTPRPAPSAS
ncbi:hypothetical protein [Streptomyces noursei]|uniref:hypothetical protein n=1 Tax=Streptomyces noursei TaxID=1971 RepID=UPI000C9CAA6F|nr:hypothetical protein [Streptomyces noursei]